MKLRSATIRIAARVVLAVCLATPARAGVIGPGVAEAIASQGHARVVVMLHVDEGTSADRASMQDAVASAQARVLGGLTAGDLQPATQWRVVPGFGGRLTASGLAKLGGHPLVRRIDLDVGGRAHLAVSVPLVRGNVVQAEGATGQGVTVAILDSGIAGSHADFAGKIVDEQCFCEDASGYGCCPNGLTSQSGAGAARDDNGHGTNVAGIVASKGTVSAKGMAPGARIVAVRVLEADGGFSSTSQVVSGLDWLAAHHPETRVVNMSLGTNALFTGTCDAATAWTQAFAAAIDSLRASGTLATVSAGNESDLQAMAAPACISSAIAVGAVYKANVGPTSHGWAGCSDATTAADKVVCFSNSSPALDLLAPGSPIISSGRGGGTSTYSGTSQAAPHVAGAVALLAEAVSTASPDQIAQALVSTGVAVTDQRNGRRTPRLDAKAALDALKGSTPAGTSLWIPVVSHDGGANGSQWRTDLGMLNTGTVQSNVDLRLYTTSGVKTTSTFVPVNTQSIVEDVVGQIGHTGSGVLEVRASQALRVTSRTFNLVSATAVCTPRGTLGQSYEAYRVQDGLSAGQSAYLAGLREYSAYRTNIGLANIGPGQASVTVFLYDGSGGLLTSYTVTLDPGDWKQENRPFYARAGQTNMTRGYAKVVVSSGTGVVAVGSVIDNLTNDPTTVLMLR